MAERTAVLLFAHGTPETLDDIPAYLRNIIGGRPLADPVVEEIRHRYSLIGQSPLTELTLEQGRLLSRNSACSLRRHAQLEAVHRRRGRPDARGWHRSRAAICLAPQNSRTSVGLYRQAAFAAADGREIEFVDGWADHPLLADAFADRLAPLRAPFSAEVERRRAGALYRAQRPLQHDPDAAPRPSRVGDPNPLPIPMRLMPANTTPSSPNADGLDIPLLVLCVPEPGPVRRTMDRPHRRRHTHRVEQPRAPKHSAPARRLPLRSR